MQDAAPNGLFRLCIAFIRMAWLPELKFQTLSWKIKKVDRVILLRYNLHKTGAVLCTVPVLFALIICPMCIGVNQIFLAFSNSGKLWVQKFQVQRPF